MSEQFKQTSLTEEQQRLEDSRAVFEHSYEARYSAPEEIENELRDLLKKRGVEISDLDLIKRVERNSARDGNIHVVTISGSVYSVNPQTMEGKYSISEPIVDHNATEGGLVTEVTTTAGHEYIMMHRNEVEKFIGKYKPELLADLFLEAKANIDKKYTTDRKRGDLSF